MDISIGKLSHLFAKGNTDTIASLVLQVFSPLEIIDKTALDVSQK